MNNFWLNKKVLVTGAVGFVGSALVKKLAESGSAVYALVRSNDSRAKTLSGERLDHKVKILNCDLNKPAAVREIFDQNGFDIIFHMAGFAIVSKAAKNPLETYYDNFLSTLHLLEAARLHGVKNIVVASSDKAYGHHAGSEPEPLPYKEGYGLRGLDMYSASKACADVLSQSYAFQYGMKIAVARPCNIYGPGDLNFTRLVPRTSLRLYFNKRPIIKFGHEKVLREYLFISDAVEAFLLLAEKLDTYYGEKLEHMPTKGVETVGWPAFNLGSYDHHYLQNIAACGNIKNVAEVIGTLRGLLNDLEPEVVLRPQEYIEIPDEYSDSSKLLRLGFSTKVSFEQGMARTINWYREKFSHFKPQAYEQELA